MSLEPCVKPKNVILYIIDEFISAVKAVGSSGVSGLDKIVLPTLESLRDVVEEVEENVISWESVVTIIAIIVNTYVISVLYDNASETCLEALVDWLKASKGTPLEWYSKAVARYLNLPIEI